MHCTYCGLLKGICWVETTLNSEKIKPVTLVVIELCWSEGISLSVCHQSQQKIALNKGNILGYTEGTFGLIISN